MRRSWLGMVFSVTLHALLVAALTRVTLEVSRPFASPRAAIVWLAPLATPGGVTAPPAPDSAATNPPPRDQVEPEPPATRATAPKKVEPPPAPDSTAPRIIPPTPATPENGAQTPVDGPAPLDRTIDLTEARQRAAKEVLEERNKAKSYRSHSFPGTIAEQEAADDQEQLRRRERGLQQPLTAFDSPSKGRAGLGGLEDGLKESMRWTSDDCYQFMAKPSFTLLEAAQYMLSLPQNICVRRLPRGDLFATSKPAYLMNEEERAANEKAVERLEELRRPTTGVAMPLSER